MSESAVAPVVPKRRRRWLRFGLRTFLVVVTLAGASLGWKVRQVRLQREAVEWVRAQGGTVTYDFEHPQGCGLFPMPPQHRPGPNWLRSSGGIDYVARPRSVTLSGNHVAVPAPLAKFTALEELYLAYTRVNDLAPLASLTALRFLDLSRTQVADLVPLAKLTALQELNLAGTPVSDESVAELQRALPSLSINR